MPPKKTRVFLDSNVLLSGLFSDKGAPRLILDVLSIDLPVLKAVTGAYNLAEVEKNLQAKLPAAIPVFRSCLKLMNIEIVPLPIKRDLLPLAGMTAEKDLPVIASALHGAADFLVTGDKKDLLRIKKNRLPFSIVSPAEFLDEVLPGLLKGLVPPA
jgi:putative PIN family toxin of toxin-antitoxin system